jgi:hypothetical protein
VALTVAEAASESQPPRTLREWLRQKSRHALAGRHYKPAVLARLGAFFGLGLVALGLGAALPFVAHLTVLGPKATYLTLSNLGMYLVARWGLLAMANQTLRCPMAPIALPAMDVLHTLHTLLSPLRLLGKRNKW